EYGLDYTDRLSKAGFTTDTQDIIAELTYEEVERFGLLHYDKKTAEDLVYFVHK
ncbi:MAG: hypothetical protein IMY74_06365, partial [Bacteroidetes bacterium]|nr:hypothetical protein [Bacteroidota bacterium]